MKKHLLLTCAVLPLLILSCTEDNLNQFIQVKSEQSKAIESLSLTNEELTHLVLFEENNKYSEEEILNMADGLLDRMKGIATYSIHTAKSGSSTNPHIKQVWNVADAENTRSNVNPEIKAKIYLLGYENQNGFCMIADDKRLSNPLLMYSEDGDAELPVNEIGFQYVMDIFKSFIGEEIAMVESMRGDSLHRRIDNLYDIKTNEEADIRYVLTEKQTGNKIVVTDTQLNSAVFEDTMQTKRGPVRPPFTGPNWTFPKLTENWGQGAPYNLKSPNGYAGCNAVAVGMILHKWYKNYTSLAQHTVPGVTSVIAAKYQWKGYSNNWYEWPSDNSNVVCQDVSQLMSDINSSQNLAATYFFDGNGTGAPIENCARTFRNMGTLADNCVNYNAEMLYSVNGDIAVVGGKVAGTTYGHTWVVDSMARVSGTLYAHCNWGYDGTGNAMCNANAFQRAGQQYTQNLKMIRNINHFLRR